MTREDGELEEVSGVSVHAGFPNPATDRSLGELDLNRLLITHRNSTFLFRLRGDDWNDLGIFDGDIAVVDRSLDASKGDVVVWWDTERGHKFMISYHETSSSSAIVWGVVTTVIHQLKGLK